ncbi:MAG: hypothetical protein FWE16_04235 [Firmicutes bacterium]|nr:hypothetical protein [Bacillota bacterium]
MYNFLSNGISAFAGILTAAVLAIIAVALVGLVLLLWILFVATHKKRRDKIGCPREQKRLSNTRNGFFVLGFVFVVLALVSFIFAATAATVLWIPLVAIGLICIFNYVASLLCPCICEKGSCFCNCDNAPATEEPKQKKETPIAAPIKESYEPKSKPESKKDIAPTKTKETEPTGPTPMKEEKVEKEERQPGEVLSQPTEAVKESSSKTPAKEAKPATKKSESVPSATQKAKPVQKKVAPAKVVKSAKQVEPKKETVKTEPKPTPASQSTNTPVKQEATPNTIVTTNSSGQTVERTETVTSSVYARDEVRYTDGSISGYEMTGHKQTHRINDNAAEILNESLHVKNLSDGEEQQIVSSQKAIDFRQSAENSTNTKEIQSIKEVKEESPKPVPTYNFQKTKSSSSTVTATQTYDQSEVLRALSGLRKAMDENESVKNELKEDK